MAPTRLDTPQFSNQPLDALDKARALMSFRGQPIEDTPTVRPKHRISAAGMSVYVFDEESGMAYLVD